MRFGFLFWVLLLAPNAPAIDDVREIAYPRSDLRPLNMPPTYGHGYLAVHDRGGISVYGIKGDSLFRLDNSQAAGVRNVAFDIDGTMAAVAAFNDQGGHVVLCAPNGRVLRDIPFTDAQPSSVAFAPDHSVWVTVVRAKHRATAGSDYNLLRHYTPEGKLLGAFLRRSSFRTVDEPIETTTALPNIRVADNRIGLFLIDRSDASRLWLETDFDGKELGRWKFPVDGVPFAFTGKGVYAETRDGMYRLDRSTGNWTRLTMALPGTAIGADGERLVFSDRSRPFVYFLPELRE